MSLFRREKKRPDRRMVWVTTSTRQDGDDERFVLNIRKAYVSPFSNDEALLFEGEYPSRFRRWRALRGWWRANRKQYWYTNFMLDFDAWT